MQIKFWLLFMNAYSTKRVQIVEMKCANFFPKKKKNAHFIIFLNELVGI